MSDRYPVLRIDKLRRSLEQIGTVGIDLDWSTRKILRALRAEGLLSEYSKGRVYIHDDGYSLAILDKATDDEFLFISYGGHADL